MIEYQIIIKQLQPQTPDSYWYSASCYTETSFFASDFGDTKEEALGKLIMYLLKTKEPFTVKELI